MWKEVVAAKIKTDNREIITNDLVKLKSAADLNLITEPIVRGVVELMSYFDLGPRWDALAKSPTLFYWDGGSEFLTVKQYNEMEINRK